ncbi:transaldolase family protein [Leifsonia sp. NPDC080035]|uniref:Transaldolase family protein n=1 Tax=Leifsonia sp. NPDC080035 TaxID=3143936 RepID=A0AAU7GGN7_9MICO
MSAASTGYRLYADSADEAAVGALLDAGVVAGVTTNPTILRRASFGPADIPRLHARWTAAGARRVFFQAWGGDAAEMLARGRRLAELGPNLTVKLPATRAGFAAGRALAAEGTSVLVTAVYAPGQALGASAIGAEFIAPYLGRLNDAGRDGVAEIGRMAELLDGTGTSVLAASLRAPDAVVELAGRGVRSFTAALDVVWALLQDETSDVAARVFEEDSV